MFKNKYKKISKKKIDLYSLPKILARYSCPIIKVGKQHITLLDKITSNNSAEIVKIESF